MAGGYGFSEAFLKLHPELRPLITEAVAGSWTDEAFLDALRTSTWWKTTSDAQKRYDVLVAENRREANTQVERTRQTINRMLVSMGMSLSANQILSIATLATRNGWNETELRYYVGTQFSHGGNSGLIGRSRQELTKLYADYGVSMSSSGMNNAIEQILQGVRTTEDFRANAAEAAKALYQGAADLINQGMTVRQIMDPYLAMASEELGRPVTSMDITDSMWNTVLQYRGEKPVSATPQRMMTNDEWVAKLRTDTRYGWDSTQTAQRSASILSTQLMQAMGARG